ncbi:hypothetical protein G9A89_019700, partial [Geosiphon pyriformis]
MYHAYWETGSGSRFLVNSLLLNIDWFSSSLVWHSDLHMAASFTNRLSVGVHTYFIKALYHWLS